MTAMSLEVVSVSAGVARIGPYRLTNNVERREWTITLRRKVVGKARTLSEAQTLVSGWDR